MLGKKHIIIIYFACFFSYEGRGGLCDIALSEPLLKLRPRKDLVETLLHEMIHAFLFVTNRDQDRDGHGPNFKAHMHRINNSAGLNISIYHSFHDEVMSNFFDVKTSLHCFVMDKKF